MIDRIVQVFVASLAGHRSRYVRTLLEMSEAEGPALEITTFDDPAELPAGTAVHREAGRPGLLRRALAVARSVRRAQDGRVLLLDGDASAVELLTLVLAPMLSRRLELSTLIMRPPTRWAAPITASEVRADLKLRALRLATFGTRVHVHPLDDSPGAWTDAVAGRWLRALTPAVDPIEIRPGARPEDLPADLPRPWCLCPGRLMARKNVALLLEAWNHTPPPAGTLILAGDSEPALRPTIRRGLAEPTGTICWLDRWLAEEELDRLVVDSDVVLLLHDNPAPSRNLGKALAAGTPVIGSRIEQIQRLEPRQGVTSIATDLDSLLGALERHARRAERGRPSIDVGSPEDFARLLLGRRASGSVA